MSYSHNRDFCGPRDVAAASKLSWLIGTVMLFGCVTAQADAKVIVQGDPDEVSLTAEDAPISEVLSALAAQFKVTIGEGVPVPDPDRRIDGTFAGTLREVLGRIFDGYNYVASFSNTGVELKVWARPHKLASPASARPPSGPLPLAPFGSPTAAAIQRPAPSPVLNNMPRRRRPAQCH